jgi:hypothetical protein
MKKNFLTELIGWYGVIALLGAYGALSFGYIVSDSVLFQTLNATGALGIVIDALAQKNWQPAVLNIVWGLVAVFALVKILS